MSKVRERDMRRILSAALRENRAPTDMEMSEALSIALLRKLLAEGKTTIAAMREQVGGADRETTIRKMAKTLAYHQMQMEVAKDFSSVTMPDGLRETLSGLAGRKKHNET